VSQQEQLVFCNIFNHIKVVGNEAMAKPSKPIGFKIRVFAKCSFSGPSARYIINTEVGKGPQSHLNYRKTVDYIP